MKKIIKWGLIASLALLLVGCTEKSPVKITETDPKTAEDKLAENSKAGKPLLTMFLTSDTHIGRNDVAADNYFTATSNMKKKDPDAILINTGDATDDGAKPQLDLLFKAFDNFNSDNVLFSLGNHEVRGKDDTKWSNDDKDDPEYFAGVKKNYLEMNKKFSSQKEVYFDKWINDYHFIVLNTEKGLKDSTSISDTQLAWLEEKLSEKSESKQPIFVLNHQPINDTHWRANLYDGFGSQNDKVKEILGKYPQVFFLNGHIHNGIGVTEVMESLFGTLVEIPSFSLSENGVTPPGAAYYLKVYPDKVVLEPWNFVTNKHYEGYDVTIKLPTLSVLYQEKQKSGKKESIEAAKGILESSYDTSIFDTPEGNDVVYESEYYNQLRLFNEAQRETINQIRKELTE